MYSPRAGLRRHVNADIVTNTKLAYPEHASSSGICSNCIKCGSCEIGEKARKGRPLSPEPFGVCQFGAEKKFFGLSDLQIIPELFGDGQWYSKVSTECEIGGFKSSAPMSIAALGSTRVASVGGEVLSSGAAKAGLVRVLGENVLVTFGEKRIKQAIDTYHENSKKLGGVIVQINANEEKLGLGEKAVSLGADALEIKLGQGAKQNLGGQIKFTEKEAAKKYRDAGYEVYEGKDFFERHAFPGHITDDALRTVLTKHAEYGVPLWVKIGIGRGIISLVKLLSKIQKEQGVPIKCLTVDGFGGGTGMSPWFVMNEMSLPSATLFTALDKKPNFNILVAGGCAEGADIAKVIMLGADGVSLGRSMLIAVTTDPVNGVPNFTKALREELQMVCATQRVGAIQKLVGRKQNLFALSSEAAKAFGVNDDPKMVL